jgi:hypothetical protein
MTDASSYTVFTGDWKAYVATMNAEADCWIRKHPLGENHGYILTSASEREFAGGKWQVSRGDGRGPLWRRDGKELFYLSAGNKLLAVTVDASDSTLSAGDAHVLFDSQSYGVFARYYNSADGQRFVVVYEGSQPSSTLTFISNWTAELKKK